MHRKKKKQVGVTLIEVLVVTAIIGLLLIIGIVNALRQLEKSRDAERKSDLQEIKVALEGYYDEHLMYPTETDTFDACGEAFEHYLKEIPCDPLDNTPYIYDPYPDGTAYRLLAKLENEEDEVIVELACDGDEGCGYVGRPNYNYGTSAGRRVSDSEPSTGDPENPNEPPVDLCEGETLQDHVCDNSGICNSCGSAPCKPGFEVYSCHKACTALSDCTDLQ